MADKITRRHVFYISGFDPRGARHYHSLYREHARKQADVNGMHLDVSARRKVSSVSHLWSVSSHGNQEIKSTIEFLSWTDIIRDNWAKSFIALCADVWFCLRRCLFNGLVFKYLNARKGWLKLAVFYPFFYLPIVFVSSIALFFAALYTMSMRGDSPALSVTLALAAAALLLMGAFRIGNKVSIFWLVRIFSFSVRWCHGKIPGMEERLDAFATRLQETMQSREADEIIVIGHSVGAMLAVPVVARAIRGLPHEDVPHRVALLTLGSCIPLMSFQPRATSYRAELDAVALDRRVQWVDYSAPPDGASFSEIDPVTGSGCVSPTGPLMLSPRFHKLYEDKKYRRLKYNWFKLHFLYLQSTDIKGAYDYFDITAGPTPFGIRFATEAEHE